jgi:hypothetical protein
MNLSKDVTEYLEDFGLPHNFRQFSSQKITEIDGFFPKSLSDFIVTYGRWIFEDGAIQLTHPSDCKGVAALIFGADAVFSHNNCHVYAHNAFGKLFAWHLEYGFTSLDILSGTILCPALTKKSLRLKVRNGPS